MCASYCFPDGSEVLYPFILRTVSSGFTDVTSPYGYGGQFVWNVGDNVKSVANSFWREFDLWAESTNVVTEFVRFTLFSDEVLPFPGQRLHRARNVVRSLQHDEAEMWMDFEQKVRKNVKKAQRSGVSIEVDMVGSEIESFLGLYRSTMDRRSAESLYYFERAFFDAIHRDLAGSFAYFHAIHDSKIISTELVLISAENVYSFLGGTDSAAFDLRPNDLLKYEIIRWSRDQGKKRFVIGGGREPEDGIFKYKLSFAPRGAVPFFTGQRVLNEELYRTLTDRRRAAVLAEGREWNEEGTFFPAYRA